MVQLKLQVVLDEPIKAASTLGQVLASLGLGYPTHVHLVALRLRVYFMLHVVRAGF